MTTPEFVLSINQWEEHTNNIEIITVREFRGKIQNNDISTVLRRLLDWRGWITSKSRIADKND